MGWWDDWGKDAVIGASTGGLGLLATHPDWLSERSGTPTSNVPEANRNDFVTPGGADRANRLLALADQYGGRAAPQAEGTQASDSSFRDDQQSLVNRLRNQMNGGDSLSDLQLRQATDSNIAQQRSLAAAANPQNAAMAQRLAAQNIGRINQGLGQQAAQLGIQERNAAANALGGVAGQARQQDLGLSQFNAGQRQQNNQFNVGASLQQTGLNDQASGNARQQELANAALRQQGNMGYQQNQTTRRGQDLSTPQAPQNWERLVGAAGSIAPFFMAKGGVVTKPTNAIIGEAGPEAVIPLSQLPTLIDRLRGGLHGDTAYGPPRPPEGPAPPAAQAPPWRAKTQRELDAYSAGQSMRSRPVGDANEGGYGRTRPGAHYQQPSFTMSQGEFDAWLRGQRGE